MTDKELKTIRERCEKAIAELWQPVKSLSDKPHNKAKRTFQGLKSGVPKITTLYAYTIEDENGHECICGLEQDGLFHMWVNSDMQLMEKLRPLVKRIATERQCTIKLVEFTHCTEIEEIK